MLKEVICVLNIKHWEMILLKASQILKCM